MSSLCLFIHIAIISCSSTSASISIVNLYSLSVLFTYVYDSFTLFILCFAQINCLPFVAFASFSFYAILSVIIVVCVSLVDAISITFISVCACSLCNLSSYLEVGNNILVASLILIATFAFVSV